MESKTKDGTRTPRRMIDKSGEPGQRRPYQKPRIERHLATSSILGNASPTTADGLSNTFRN